LENGCAEWLDKIINYYISRYISILVSKWLQEYVGALQYCRYVESATRGNG
jgi:hypothetical protein